MNIPAITNYKNSYNLSFQKIKIDESINQDVLYELLNNKEIDKLHEAKETIKIKERFGKIEFIKPGYFNGYAVGGKNTEDTVAALKELKAHKVLMELNKIEAEKAAIEAATKVETQKVKGKLDEINKDQKKLVLTNYEDIPSKAILAFISSPKLKMVYDKYPIKCALDGSTHWDSALKKDFLRAEISLLTNPVLKISGKYAVDASNFEPERVINFIERAIEADKADKLLDKKIQDRVDEINNPKSDSDNSEVVNEKKSFFAKLFKKSSRGNKPVEPKLTIQMESSLFKKHVLAVISSDEMEKLCEKKNIQLRAHNPHSQLSDMLLIKLQSGKNSTKLEFKDYEKDLDKAVSKVFDADKILKEWEAADAKRLEQEEKENLIKAKLEKYK